MCENFRKSLFDLHDSEFFTFPDFWYTFGMFNLPWSFQPPHLQEPILDPPLHHPNLLQGPHLWVSTITPFGPILVLQVVKTDASVLSDVKIAAPPASLDLSTSSTYSSTSTTSNSLLLSMATMGGEDQLLLPPGAEIIFIDLVKD